MKGKSKVKKSNTKPVSKKQSTPKANETKSDDEMSLKELRLTYPHITARSKKEFLTELKESNVQG